ncbi:lysine 2,3-aminomutase [Bacillus thuringiensis]|uniref:Lysine 2,3-aminomutase n=1 Tax=Bacillus thuringiensis TaxID=1428 RepID=A0A9X7BL87_BACTU|nr:LCI fold-containing protein [Bacillus thuringiensis]PFV28638.1 lysine 2,3-aminomutase [Bacillus thuringiensis]PGN17262.1 lysine 2,3-aminomutase [Bacillus thuringiensis]PGN26685.1 lysine 2,3-aminomutase [Bacillus thuringiensis]
MFKKLVVGALATGIMLSGAGGVMAATPNTESPKSEKVTMAVQPIEKIGIYKHGYASREDIPNVVKDSSTGITWYLKNAYIGSGGRWTAYFEGWRV